MLGRALVVVVCLTACACPGSSRPADPQPPTTSADAATATASPDAAEEKPMKIQDPPPSTEYTRGPALVPSAELRTWLEGTRSDIGQRKIRLPVWFEMSGMTVKSTRIGAADGPDVVKVKLRDSALGVPLADRARRAAKDGGTPAMWLEGIWEADGKFSVTRFIDVIPADQADAATYVEIEARP